MHIPDEYTAYCLDEACAYISGRLDAGDEILFKQTYHNFSDFYSQLDGKE